MVNSGDGVIEKMLPNKHLSKKDQEFSFLAALTTEF